jgi:hypothetical protein
MARNKLTDDQKLHIGECYASGVWTQDRLAELYDVSRKTIYRILLDLGLLQPKEGALSPGSARIVELVRSLGLDEHNLYQALNQPVMSRDNMVAVLAAMELPDIETLFNDVVQRKHLANHGTIPNDSPLATHPDDGTAAEGRQDAPVPVV